MNKEYLEVKHFLNLKLQLGFAIHSVIGWFNVNVEQEQAAKEAAAAAAKEANPSAWEAAEKSKKVEEWLQRILVAFVLTASINIICC